MKKRTLLSLITFLTVSATNLYAQDLEKIFDDLARTLYQPESPGLTVLVAKNDDILYRKAFGMANMELKVPMKPENVFELGSITKQFTAVAILMLMEQGKIDLLDPITTYVPDYPMQGKQITIHHLLNHTSGIKSYTEMGDLSSFARNDKTPTELIDYFKNEPMDFNPGDAWHYNNSGYIILGHIIEVVSGMSYADFIETNIFQPLGMTNSYYGSHTQLIRNRASGYMPSESGYRNADYLSMTLPYAAGSLMSTVDDMFLWFQAIRDNTLISAQSKAKAFTDTKLNNGKPTHYGYGWQIDEINGVQSIEHGGGIFGYVTQGVYVPSENVYVIILTNRNGNSPQSTAIKMAAHAIGEPFPSPKKAVALSDAQLQKWVGNYDFEGVYRNITLREGSLYSQREGSDPLKLYPVSENDFYFEDGLARYVFALENGQRTALFSQRIDQVKGMETGKKPATEKEVITIDPAVLPDYEGTYELQPGFSIAVTVKDEKLYAQATGQPEFEIFPEAKDTFFLKVVAAQLVFGRDAQGTVVELTLKQGGQEITGVRK
ncbi:serine hydrolase [Flavobacteriaceae bacterium TP-CH-4]|uniref:Serine hydrolase n=1 Tax=Pelagihabitans pacificus TaxID=2696054 RepID=A0A967AUY4_9FLAO|nr:serine hydrolase [Pelagihabitans pacificus]NHF58047.1 serine hydrolase [Pelagihabitans pacificus]